MIAAQNVAPAFHTRRSIAAEDLKRLQEPALIFEHFWRDEGGEPCWAYTVAGWLDGENVASMQGGVTVGGDVLIVHAPSRPEADVLAGLILQDTIVALHGEQQQHDDAIAALGRLASVNPVRRLELATAAEKNPDFTADQAAIRPLRGDDIVLAAGGVVH